MSVKTLKKGKHRVYWRDEQGRQRNRTIRGNQTKAKAFEKELRDQVTRLKAGLPGSFDENSAGNRPEIYSAFLAEFCERHAEEHSENNARSHLNAGVRLIRIAGDLPLTEYTTRDILQVRSKILSEGLSPRSANRAVAHIKTQFGHALEFDLIPKNPAASRLLKPIREHASPRKALTLEKIRRVVNYADEPYNRLLTMCYTLGLRVGELFDARIEHIQGDTLVIPRTKTFKPRQIPLPAVALQAIEALRGKRSSGRLVETHSGKESFKAHLVTVLRIAYYRAENDGEDPPRLNRHWAQKNIRGITTQDLRHSFVSILRAAGVDSDLRARLAGHTAKVDERIYTHIAEPDLRDAMQRAFGSASAATEHSDILPVVTAITRGAPLPDLTREQIEALEHLYKRVGTVLEKQSRDGSFERSVSGD